MTWNSPTSIERVLRITQLTGLSAGDLVLDIGCGTGDLLASLAAEGIDGWGVDASPEVIALAQENAPNATFVTGDAGAISLPTDAALAICLGSTHALAEGAHQQKRVAGVLRDSVKCNGYVLIGEGYQKQPLPAEYGTFLGSPSGIENTHGQNVSDFESAGLTCISAITTTDAEWEEFEWAFFRRHGNRTWRDMWLNYGRPTMGFGVYLLQKTQVD